MLLLALFLPVTFASAQYYRILVMEMKSEIDPRMTRYVDLALKRADETHANLVIIEMDTYGGILTDAKEIVDRILRFDTPVWVFINSDAASAGALISIACDSIYMSPGASIGAATVVDAAGNKAPDKFQSYMRSIMRSTAEANGRDPRIAEGMVDESVTIEGIKEAGKVITFSTSEAIKHGFCEAQVKSIAEILERNGILNYQMEYYRLAPVEKIIAFVLNPFVSSLLILIIIAGIYFEMQSPGLGFAGLAALVALILYLIPYYLNGLAENWEILALVLGILLVGLELFVIPGFGVAGIAGIGLTVGSLILIMLNNDAFNFDLVRMHDILVAAAAVSGGVLGGVAVLFLAGARLRSTRFYKKVALTTTQDRSEGYVSTATGESLVGKKGTAYTVLRPSGKVLIDEKIYDAYTRGDFIEKGQPIEVISDEGPSLRVKIST